jgi:hypothetical protein
MVLPTTAQNRRRKVIQRMKVCQIAHLLSALSKYTLAIPEKAEIEDRTETNLVNMRRVIYLTIMNALNYEEAVHKLLKVQLKEGEEVYVILYLRCGRLLRLPD